MPRRTGGLTGAAALLLVVGAAAGVTGIAGCGVAENGVRVEGSPAVSEGPRASASLVSTPPPSAPSDRSGDSGEGGESEAEKAENSEKAQKAEGEGGKVDVLALLRADPKVSSDVKRNLRKPCTGHVWPVDVAYGHLTGSETQDMVVNVTSCDTGFGQGSYVYRHASDGSYDHVFTKEEPPVYAEVSGRVLKVVKDVYVGDEPTCCPTGRYTTTYVWRDGSFKVKARAYDDTGDTGASPSPAPGAGTGSGAGSAAGG
ncbi:hypothetical protein ACWGJ2_34010 [Streptomyces sp. NPDC054796]